RVRPSDAGIGRTAPICGLATVSTAMSLKAKIRNIAKRKNIPAQVILQNYMFERLLVRLAASTYQAGQSVCRGGFCRPGQHQPQCSQDRCCSYPAAADLSPAAAVLRFR